MKPAGSLKNFWNNNGDRIKTWFVVVIIVTAVYISVTYVMWGLFTPERAVIYGIVFILFYEVFSRMLDKISQYRKEKKDEELVFRAGQGKEEGRQQEVKVEKEGKKPEKEARKGKQ